MNKLEIKEYNNSRILTTQQIAEAYETEKRTISNNFNRNKDKYQEGKHYFILSGNEKVQFLNRHQIDDGSKNAEKLYLWTEKGAFLHAKSLNTDKAWEMYDKLIDEYFRLSKPMTAIERITLNSQGILELNDRVNKIEDKISDMPLFNAEMDEISKQVSKKAIACLGGKHSVAYNNRSICKKVYSDIYNYIHRQFDVHSYKSINRKYIDDVKKVISEYELPFLLNKEVEATSGQQQFSL